MPSGAASPSPSPVEAGAGLVLQPPPEPEAVGHHACVVCLGVGAASDAALPVRAAPRVGQDELWGRGDMGVTTVTTTPQPRWLRVHWCCATAGTWGHSPACQARRWKMAGHGGLGNGDVGSWPWGCGGPGNRDMGVLALVTWGSWQRGHRGAGSGSGPCHGRGQPGLQVPTLAYWSWGHSGTGDTAELRTQWDKGHGRAGAAGTCSSRRVSL